MDAPACGLAMNPKKLGKIDKDEGHPRDLACRYLPGIRSALHPGRGPPPRAQSPGASYDPASWVTVSHRLSISSGTPAGFVILRRSSLKLWE
jgi:hypothetical protein